MRLLVIMPLIFVACRPTPFKVNTLPSSERSIQVNKDASVLLDESTIKSLKKQYKKANSPTFGIIKAYYYLPSKKPYGKAAVIKSSSLLRDIEIKAMSHGHEEYALKPISGNKAKALSKGMNILLDIGVNFKEISYSDALKIAQYEKDQNKNDDFFKPKTVLSPSVDYLVSIYESTTDEGRVLIGRVVSKEGNLVALRVLNILNSSPLSKMIVTLFKDTMKRIN